MSASIVTERIDAWQAAGLIDGLTADRLRADDAARAASDSAPSAGAHQAGGVANAFGPGVSIAEVFGYLGGAFLLASWTTLVALGGPTTTAIGLAIAAAAVGAIAIAMRHRTERLGRAAGVGLVVSADLLACAVLLLVGEIAGLASTVAITAAAAAGLGLAIAYRRVHPGLLTQFGVVTGVVFLAGALMSWLEQLIFGDPSASDPLAMPMLRPVLIAIGWGLTALILGLVGLAESRSDEPGAGGRAALTRFFAGMTLIVGASIALLSTGPTADGSWDRIIPAVVGDAILAGLSLILLERTARRSASAFIYPAALGIIIAATDLNATYLAASSPWFALLVEGAILLGAGFAADRFRRRIARDRSLVGTAPAVAAADVGEAGTGDG